MIQSTAESLPLFFGKYLEFIISVLITSLISHQGCWLIGYINVGTPVKTTMKP